MHKAKAVVIACMDFRLQPTYQNYLRDNGYLGETDEIIVAGASRDLVCPVEESDGKYLWKQLELSLKLHNPDTIIIFDHQDCGGYAQDGTIPSGLEIEEDIQSHADFLFEAKEKILTKYPDKTVILLHAGLDGEVAVIE